MNQIQWSGYNWNTQERWGKVHKDKSWCHYDSDCVRVDNWGNLHLETHRNPKEVEGYQSEFGVGLVSSVDKFGYGFYEIECKLPTGPKLWPAFWMWSWDSWPPEIDVFEGYTTNNGGYLKFNRFNPFGWWNVPTNIWTESREGRGVNLKARTGWMGFKDPSKHFMKYSVLILEDLIEIQHNGRVVRRIEDEEILKHFIGTEWNVIINNHFQENPPEGDNYSDFVIKSFHYEQRY